VVKYFYTTRERINDDKCYDLVIKDLLYMMSTAKSATLNTIKNTIKNATQ